MVNGIKLNRCDQLLYRWVFMKVGKMGTRHVLQLATRGDEDTSIKPNQDVNKGHCSNSSICAS
jgi:hypothetical protein